MIHNFALWRHGRDFLSTGFLEHDETGSMTLLSMEVVRHLYRKETIPDYSCASSDYRLLLDVMNYTVAK